MINSRMKRKTVYALLNIMTMDLLQKACIVLHFELNWTFMDLVSFWTIRVVFCTFHHGDPKEDYVFRIIYSTFVRKPFPPVRIKDYRSILTLFILQSNVTNRTSLYFKFSILSRYWKILYIHLMSSCRNDVNLICKCNILDSYFLNFYNFKQFNSLTRG